MANRSEAYDFALFEERFGNAAPAREPVRLPEERPEHRVVELPRETPKAAPKTKKHPLRVMAAGLAFALFTSLCLAMVYSQQQMAVLTEEINQATQTLEEAESLQVQLEMMAARRMNSAQVEEYAVNVLGMSKVSQGQTTYVAVAREDKGTVVQNAEGGSPLDQLFAAVRGWLS